MPHIIPCHPNNEYVCVKVFNGKCLFTILRACIPPKTKFDKRHLEHFLNTAPPPHIITGDFNAHHYIWSSLRTNHRGRCLADIAYTHDLSMLKDASLTYLRETDSSSRLDLTFVSTLITSQATWLTDVETRCSDHIPIYTIL